MQHQNPQSASHGNKRSTDGLHGRVSEQWHKLRHWLRLDDLSPRVRRIVVGMVGGTLLLVGLAMIVLPGPAFIVIPLALGLLGTEFVWAKRCVQKARTLFRKAKGTAGGG